MNSLRFLLTKDRDFQKKKRDGSPKSEDFNFTQITFENITPHFFCGCVFQ